MDTIITVFIMEGRKEGGTNGINWFKTDKGNTIWAAALNLAWNQLAQLVKEKPQMTVEGEERRIVDNFNARVVNKQDLLPQNVYTKAGKGQQTVDLINKELAERFPDRTMAPLNLHLQQSDIIAYAYLLKKILFEVKFSRNPHGNFHFRGSAVPSFRAQNAQQKKQLMCLRYESPEDFLLMLRGRNPVDRLYLMKAPRQMETEEVISLVLKSEQHGSFLGKQDSFQMPVVDLNCTHRLQGLINKPFCNPALVGYFLTEIIQRVKLSIDEEGARVQNEGVMVLSRCMVMHQNPKICFLDRQFWVVMREKDKHPYFCAQIVSPSDTD